MDMMKRNKSIGDWIADIIIYVAMIAVSLICVYPMLFKAVEKRFAKA